MARQTINTGTVANDNTGDTMRNAGTKINANFSEIYTILGGDSVTPTTKMSFGTNSIIAEGATDDAHETTFRIDEPTADRIASLQDKTGTIALLSGFKLNATDGSASNDGDFLVLNTSADENDRLLFEDGTTDPLSVLASHGITLVGQGWNAFQFDNT